MKLVHFILDNKFTVNVFENFDCVKNVDNKYVCLLNRDQSSVQYISDEYEDVIYLKLKDIKSIEYLLDEATYIIIHSLNVNHVKFINMYPKLNYVWVGMGFDYYDMLSNGLFYKYSLKYKRLGSIKSKIKNFIKVDFLFRLKKHKAILNITHFSPVLESEYHLLSKKYKHLKYIAWNYGASAKILNKNMVVDPQGESLLLGNSADPTNNHYEVLECLHKLQYKGNIILPLSYGDFKYREKLLSDIYNFDLNITPIFDYMDKDEYFDILKKCNVIIMNNRRQQAASNVFVMMAMGAKVFLNSDSLLYGFFESNGSAIFNIKDLSIKHLTNDLTIEQKEINKKFILKNFSQDAIFMRTREFCNRLSKMSER